MSLLPKVVFLLFVGCEYSQALNAYGQFVFNNGSQNIKQNGQLQFQTMEFGNNMDIKDTAIKFTKYIGIYQVTINGRVWSYSEESIWFKVQMVHGNSNSTVGESVVYFLAGGSADGHDNQNPLLQFMVNIEDITDNYYINVVTNSNYILSFGVGAPHTSEFQRPSMMMTILSIDT